MMQRILIKSILSVILLIAVIVIGAVAALKTTHKTPEQVTETSTEPLYTLSDYDGKIALYKSGFSMPVEIYDVYVYTLPQSEQDAITTGITALSDEDAQRLIEDYTS